MSKSPAFARIRRDVLRIVDTIPNGKVATSAAVGALIDVPARHVAYVLAMLDPEDAAKHAWHRVVSKEGKPAKKPQDATPLLSREGVALKKGMVDLSGHEWYPKPALVTLEASQRPAPYRRGQQGGPALAELRGLGPKSLSMLAGVGIDSAEALHREDAFALFARLREKNPAVSLNLLYALLGAQQDRDWRDVARNDRTMVLMRLDDLGLASNPTSARQRVRRPSG